MPRGRPTRARRSRLSPTKGQPPTGSPRTRLVAIYSGTMTQWPDGTPVRLVLRPVHESDNQLLRWVAPGMDQAMDAAFARDGLVSASTDQENAEALESLPGSLGVVALGQVVTESRALKVLTLDGVHPSAEAGGAFGKELLLVLTPAASPLATEFAAFVTSPEGQAVLTRTGHSSVN